MTFELLVPVLTSLSASSGKILAQAIAEVIKRTEKRDDIQVIIQDGSVFLKEGGEVEDLATTLREIEDEIGESQSVDQTGSVINTVLAASASLRDERRLQAKLTFFAALTFSILGVIIIFVGVVLLFYRDDAFSGAVTTGSGVVSGVVSAMLFKFYIDTNDRFDAVMRDTQILEKAQIALSMASRIENREARDRAISEIVGKVTSFGTQAI